MDQQLQTSFIPKKKAEARSIIAKVKRPMTLYSWFSTGIFVLALVITAGMFGYEKLLISGNNSRKADIQKEIKAFEPELTKALTTIKFRIDSGETLLNDHLAVSSFFSILEAITLKNVYFNDFSFTANPGNRVSVVAKGLAPSYAALSFQSDLLENADFIKDLAFSDLNLDEDGKVVFSVNATLDPGIALYKKIIFGAPEIIIKTGEESGTTTPAEDEV